MKIEVKIFDLQTYIPAITKDEIHINLFVIDGKIMLNDLER